MADTPQSHSIESMRLLIVGLVAVIVVLGLALVVMAIGQPPAVTQGPSLPDALANSSDACVTCHRGATPGILDEYGHSTMAAAKVTCRDCHETPANYPGAVEHQGTWVLQEPTTAKCQKCHPNEVAQFLQSRHSIPAWVAFAGAKNLSPALLAAYQAIPESEFNANRAPNAIGAQEPPEITQFACETCHSIGKPQADGSIGTCTACHLRHQFSLVQARKPETCSACHIGPDHPQWEIYQESPHGVAYLTTGAAWNWNAQPGTLTVKDFSAPTCATCHISGFGASPTTHDVGDRLTWFLFDQTSARRPGWTGNQATMRKVCQECHNQNFIDDFYTSADKEVASVNSLVGQADTILAPLNSQHLLSNTPYDDPIKYTYFEIWHHWGRTAKFGAWMQGPDYTQWHGVYELQRALVDLKSQADALLKAAK